MTNFPARFLERMKTIVPAESWDDFLEFSTAPLPKTLRKKKSADFSNPEWKLSPVAGIEEASFIERDDHTVPLGKMMEHFNGEVYIASLSSLLAAKVLAPESGDKVLDLCAAPGSKTTFLAEMVGDDGCVIANELSASRIKKLAANIDRIGCSNTVICQNDGASMYHFLDQEFDKILLDAPCSSEGYGRKSAKFFGTQWEEKKIFDCAKLQKKLIISAFNMLRPGGEMLYSTCTGAPEENEAVVEFLLKTFPNDVEVLPVDLGDIPHTKGVSKFSAENFSSHVSENVRRLWPHLRSKTWDSESFFLAKIRKKNPLKKSPALKTFTDSSLKKLSKNQAAEIIVRFVKAFGLERSLFTGYSFIEKKGELFVTNDLAFHFAKKNRYQRLGIKILDKHGNITQEFAQHFGSTATKRVIDISKEERDRFLTGYDLEKSADFFEDASGAFKNIYLVRFDRFCLGWGKQVKSGVLKNKLARDLVF